MDVTSFPDRKITQDLLARTEIDARLALDTLLENINRASLVTLLRPDIEVLAKAFPDLSKILNPILSTDSSPTELSALQEAENEIWSGVTSSGARGQQSIGSNVGRVSAPRRVANSILGALARLVGALRAQPAINKEAQRDAIFRAGRISHILQTSEALNKAIDTTKKEQNLILASGTPPGDYERLKNLLKQAELVSYYTRLWAVYENAWRQHLDESIPLAKAIKAGDAVVHSLYDRISLNQQLRLRVPGQQLVTVFYESRVLTRVSDFPVQYIVAPYWGHKLIWNWLAFAHEIGHHVWANVGGEYDTESSGLSIRDELFVHLTAFLLSETSPDERLFWSKWMEEMFADLFCLLLIGPAAIHSMQHMFFALPPQDLSQHLKIMDPQEWLRRAYDDEHPIPYLRVYLNLDTLRLLDSRRFASEIKSISNQWRRFFRDEADHEPALDVYTFSSDRGISMGKMRAIGEKMLDIMLNTPLFALGRKDEPDGKRALREVFFDGHPSNLEQKIEKAQDALKARNWEECKIKLLNQEFEIRHLLAALQFEFERLTNDPTVMDKEQSLQELSVKIISVFRDYGDEQLLQRLQEKKQDYFRKI
jgi:hypothetical protein